MNPQKSTVIIDGTLYFFIAMYPFVQSVLASDDAYKYMNPYLVFWLKFILGSLAAGFGGLKMFRSTTFSDLKKSLGDSNFWTKLPQQPKNP